MSDPVRILRLQRTDTPQDYILLRVEQISPTRPLDLKLIATEHTSVFHGSVRSADVLPLKNDRFTGTEDELRDILYSCLLQTSPDGAATSQGLEMVATLDKDMTLTIRRRVGDITSRIAAIKLAEDSEREEISPFEWVDTAVSISDKLRKQVDKVEAELTTQRDEISKLKRQLNEFVGAQKDNDAIMLQKFVALLNTKKERIREQQELLAQAGVNASAMGNKRKAVTEPEEEDEGEDVIMEDGEQDLEEDQVTPPVSDDGRSLQDEDEQSSMQLSQRREAEDSLPSRHTRSHASAQQDSHKASNGTTQTASQTVEDDDTDDDEL